MTTPSVYAFAKDATCDTVMNEISNRKDWGIVIVAGQIMLCLHMSDRFISPVPRVVPENAYHITSHTKKENPLKKVMSWEMTEAATREKMSNPCL